MKGLNLIDKLIFLVNSLFATALLLAYLLPYIPPSTFPFLSVLSLGMPLLLIINFAFFLFWAIRFKRQVLLSLFILLIGFNHILSLYMFTGEVNKTEINEAKTFSLMSYNVRHFNRYNWIKDETVTQQIIQFVEQENPDVLVMQDYLQREDVKFEAYPHKYIQLVGKSGQAIYSKYPIVEEGSLDFPKTGNNAIYADIVIQRDTLRVFNLHLESLKINPSVKELQNDSEKLIARVGNSFKRQEEQTEIVLKKIKETSYKVIIAGDLNNSAFSYVYRKLSENYTDAFKNSGNGFGKTFDFDFIPLRIDAILVDKQLKIKMFKNYDKQLSDHYPVMSVLELK
ncbi:endonuclease/exonuclease/phosphatase family protein [Mesonia ostreae]|uniref:Endonuclease/exonuclease/phosphatase family protein n=1 Tax=Mesonia ostreae TaxID=861110 RepID=A0ABU2KLR0_9FLAO|nr:endonuclease/exonuclease/phosphatase family protein [Mesonia ostreae]MDT0295617.1 endonuclease/exonuclease/phosphatase family protein [Mesonia ostreae]